MVWISQKTLERIIIGRLFSLKQRADFNRLESFGYKYQILNVMVQVLLLPHTYLMTNHLMSLYLILICKLKGL